LNLILGNLFDLRGFTFDHSYHGRIITSTGSLRLKQSSCQQVYNAKH
jgi:hypothetical protein